LFLLKIYLSNNYIKIDDILEYLETTKETLLQLGTKILADSDSEEDINDIITSIKLTDFDPDDETKSNSIMETLWHFDQILKISTIEVWLDYQTRYKQLLAAENLKAKMLALNTVNATTAMATAIMKATNNIQQAQDADLNTSLRISNLEKLSKKQEQRSNEILNKLKGTKIAKNFQGGLELESPASFTTQTPPQPTGLYHQPHMVDLTTEREGYHNTMIDLSRTPTPQRNSKKPRRTNQREKSIQWKNVEITNFNPHQPVTTSLRNPFTTVSKQSNPTAPLFPPPPPPPATSTCNTNYQNALTTAFSIPMQPTYPTTQTQNAFFPPTQFLTPQYQTTYQFPATPNIPLPQPTTPFQTTNLPFFNYNQTTTPQNTHPQNLFQTSFNANK